MKIKNVWSDVNKKLGATPETLCRFLLNTLKTTDNVQYNSYAMNDRVEILLRTQIIARTIIFRKRKRASKYTTVYK